MQIEANIYLGQIIPLLMTFLLCAKNLLFLCYVFYLVLSFHNFVKSIVRYQSFKKNIIILAIKYYHISNIIISIIINNSLIGICHKFCKCLQTSLYLLSLWPILKVFPDYLGKILHIGINMKEIFTILELKFWYINSILVWMKIYLI